MSNNMKWICLVFIVLISPKNHAEIIKLCSLERPGLSQGDGSGYYWDLLRAVYEAEGVTVEYSSAPFKRCLALVESKMVDGAVAVFRTPDRAKKFIYPKSRLSFSSYGIVHLKQTAFDKLENIESKVGIMRGYDFSAWLPSYLPVTTLSDNFQAVEMLKTKRIEYHADDLQGFNLTLKKMGEQPEKFVSREFHVRDLFVPMTNDVRGQRLADKFDSGIDKALQNGELEKLNRKHELVISLLPDFH